MLVGGLVAGQGKISLLALIAIVWTCAVLGDVTSYVLGRRLGRAWMVRHGPKLKITEERLRQVEEFFQKRGGVTILIGRFIGLVRALAPFIAGTTRMPLRVFLPYDVVGAGAWAATFSTLGYLFWQSFDKLTQYVSRGLFAFGTVVALGVGLYYLVRLRRDPELREKVNAWLREREDKPFLRPLVRLAGPAWRRVLSPAAGGVDWTARFGLRRLTPGNLGLELTTLLALGGVGAFSFFLLGDVQAELHDPRIDRMAREIADKVTFDALTDVVRIVTDLGSWPVTAAAVFATAIWASLKRRYVEALALLTGHALTWAAVHAAKDQYDRVRPPGGLVEVSLSAYPSGHAAYAVAFVACATVLVRAGVGWALRFAVVTVAVVVGRRGRLVARVPARALPHRRARRRRDGARHLEPGGHRRPVRRARASEWGPEHVTTDDKITYAVAGVAALVSLIAWVTLILVPAWQSYWRLRERLLAAVMSVYILVAFMGMGAVAGGVFLYYYDRI